MVTKVVSIMSIGRKGVINFLITGVPETLSNGDTFRLSIFGTAPEGSSCVDFKRRHWAMEDGRNECILECWAENGLYDYLLTRAEKHENGPNTYYTLPLQVWPE